MRKVVRFRGVPMVTTLLAITLGAGFSGAQQALPPDLETARDHIRAAQYEAAAETLDRILAETTDPVVMEKANLLLVSTYVMCSNDFRSRGDHFTSKVYSEKARDVLRVSLLDPRLRHMRPVPEGDFPPEMITLFREVRSAVLGGFRVTKLDPEFATVHLDGAALAIHPDLGMPEDIDLAAGPHVVEIRAPGYRSRVEEIQIQAGTTIEREYVLSRNKGMGWWATRVAMVGAGVGAVFLLGPGDDAAEPGPLPGPPDPPR